MMGIHTHVWVALGGILAALAVASLAVRWITRSKGERPENLAQRVRSWWIIVAIYTAAMLLGPRGSVVLLACVSFLALKEYLSLIPTRRADRRVLFWAYLAIPVQYFWVAAGWYGMFAIFIPVYMFLLIPVRMLLVGETEGYVRAVGVVHWGLMTTVFSLSHAAYLLALPEPVNAATGGNAGLLLYLVLLTQMNDVAQYVWGKSFGATKVAPRVSPGKTAEGLAGGVLTTCLLSLAIAPFLTPLTQAQAMTAALLIGLGGFAGDLSISAIKRDIGVKDSGHTIPGHGGILDRVDSLTYAAPLFFHFLYYTHY